MADTFHQAPVTGDNIGVVVHNFLTVMCTQAFFCHGKTDRVCDTLTKRAGGCFNAFGVAEFRVTSGDRAPLAEVFYLLKGHVLVARQVQQRIDQHGAVACRQNEAVTIGPIRVLCVKLQVLFKKHSCHVRHANGHACVTGIRCCNTVQSKRADRGGFLPVVRVRAGERCNVDGLKACIRHWVNSFEVALIVAFPFPIGRRGVNIKRAGPLWAQKLANCLQFR